MLKLNHKGIGIATAIGVVTLVLAIASTLLTYAVFQANLVNKNIERTEGYANAVQAVDATLQIIARDQNLDPTYLLDLGTYMGVSITAYNENVYMITSMVTSTKSVTSYLSGSSGDISTFSDVFSYTGKEPAFELDPLITPTALLASYLPQFITTTFPSITPETEFTDFQSIMDYLYTLTQSSGSYSLQSATILTNQSNPTVSGHWYINNDLDIPGGKNLTIPAGYLLVVDGSLTLPKNSSITGNVIINGNFDCDVRKSVPQIQGTLYVSGDVITASTNILGTESQPTFILAEGNIELGTSSTGYAYFLSTSFQGNSKNIIITGGIYAFPSPNISKTIIYDNTSLSESNFFSYALPTSVPSSGGGSGFVFTSPKMN